MRGDVDYQYRNEYSHTTAESIILKENECHEKLSFIGFDNVDQNTFFERHVTKADQSRNG